MQNLEERSWQCVQQNKEIDDKIFHLWVLNSLTINAMLY